MSFPCISTVRGKNDWSLGPNPGLKHVNHMSIIDRSSPSDQDERIRSIGHVLVLLSPWDDPDYFKRKWCTMEPLGHGWRILGTEICGLRLKLMGEMKWELLFVISINIIWYVAYYIICIYIYMHQTHDYFQGYVACQMCVSKEHRQNMPCRQRPQDIKRFNYHPMVAHCFISPVFVGDVRSIGYLICCSGEHSQDMFRVTFDMLSLEPIHWHYHRHCEWCAWCTA